MIMSSSLRWKPARPTDAHMLSDWLKFVLRKRYGDPVKAILSLTDIEYLTGIAHTASDREKATEVNELIEVLMRDVEIELYEEW